jgi:hypothetical protein
MEEFRRLTTGVDDGSKGDFFAKNRFFLKIETESIF